MYAWSREHRLKKTTDKNEFKEKLRDMLGFAVAMGIGNCQYISASGKKKMAQGSHGWIMSTEGYGLLS